MSKTPGYQDLYIEKILKDAIGFAGCKVIRRIVGLSHVADIDTIENELHRRQAKVTALEIGKRLVKQGRTAASIAQVIEWAEAAAAKEGASV
ncbi:Methylthioribose kinase [compost metagenome]